jgi:hypothetical protein
MVASDAKRVPMVVLETVALRTSAARLVHVAASAPVALVHLSPDRGRNVARGGCGIGLAQGLPRTARLREAPALEPFEFFGHGPLDDRCEIAVRNL